MSLRILMLDAYNNKIIKSFVANNKDNISNYADGNDLFANSNIGISGYYSKYLNKIEHEAHELIANCVFFQELWMKEHSINFDTKTEGWFYKLLELQIEEFKPDVVYCRTIVYFDTDFLWRIKKIVPLLAAHNACPLPDNLDLSVFSFITTPAHHYMDKFRRQGSKGELLKFAFDTEILNKINYNDFPINVSFIGSLEKEFYSLTTPIIERASEKLHIDFWGPDYYNNLDKNSPILKNYHGEAWGMDMYNILANSKITINRHIDAAQNYAGNMRLMEATGVGTLLLTDDKINISEYFEPGIEIITYRDSNELVDKAKYFLENDSERLAIAKAGQHRTLTDNNYEVRMQELVNLFYKYL